MFSRETILHLLRGLRSAPLLLGWLILGPLVALLTDGWTGLALCLVNLALIAAYAALIRWMTPTPPPAPDVKRPRLELILALGLLGLFLLVQLLDFGVWRVQPWQGWISGFFLALGRWVYNLGALPDWAQQDVFNALSTTLKQLIPSLLFFLLLGYGRQEMGLARPHWKLTAVLVGLTALFGLATGVFTRLPLAQTLALYAIGILINALPEELFFRGLLLPRLEKVMNHPLNALVISALLFNVLHVPIELSRGAAPLHALLGVFSLSYPSGLIWGYLYLRTRSIIPGALWHAANGVLGYILMSLP